MPSWSTDSSSACDLDSAFFKKFRRYAEICKWLHNVVHEYPDHAKLEVIGKSLQNRDIYMIVLKGCADVAKISVMIEGGIHAREWISPASVLYFINHITLNWNILHNVDLYVIPCLNPDGYEFTHTTERLWRKNLNDNGYKNQRYWGVDINRNFPFAYGLSSGSSSCPSSNTFRGSHGLSEPESQSLANALKKYGKYIQLYVAIHCHGQKIMYPWGYTEKPLVDEGDLRKCAMAAVNAIKCLHPDVTYTIGKISKVLYLSSGCSSDFAKGVYKIKFSYTIELPRGEKGPFEASVAQIVPVGKEVVQALKSMIDFVHLFYKTKKRKNTMQEDDACSYCSFCKRFKTEQPAPPRSKIGDSNEVGTQTH